MPRSAVYPHRKQVFFYDFEKKEEADDLLAFLHLMFEAQEEQLKATRNENGVLVDYSEAPKTWALDQAIRAGQARPSYDGEYIRFDKPTPAK